MGLASRNLNLIRWRQKICLDKERDYRDIQGRRLTMDLDGVGRDGSERARKRVDATNQLLDLRH